MTRNDLHVLSVREWQRLRRRREQVRYRQPRPLWAGLSVRQWRTIYAPILVECPRVRGYGPVAGPFAHWQQPCQTARVYRAVGLTPPPALAERNIAPGAFVFSMAVHGGSLAGGRRVGVAFSPPQSGEGDYYPSDEEGEEAAEALARETGLGIKRF